MPSITFTISQANLPRVLAAFSITVDPAENPIPATPEIFRQAVISFVKQKVRRYESDIAQQQASASIPEVDIT